MMGTDPFFMDRDRRSLSRLSIRDPLPIQIPILACLSDPNPDPNRIVYQ